MMNTAEQIRRRIAGSLAEKKFGTPVKFGVKFASEVARRRATMNHRKTVAAFNATCDWFRVNQPVADPGTVGCLFTANNTKDNGTLLVADNVVYVGRLVAPGHPKHRESGTTSLVYEEARTVVSWRKDAPMIPMGWDNLTFDPDGEVETRTPAMGFLSRRDELGMAKALQDEVMKVLAGVEGRTKVGNDYIGNGSLCAAAVKADRSKARAKAMEEATRSVVEATSEVEFDCADPRSMKELAKVSLPTPRNTKERNMLDRLRKMLSKR
jgi:hypothetical protein